MEIENALFNVQRDHNSLAESFEQLIKVIQTLYTYEKKQQETINNYKEKILSQELTISSLKLKYPANMATQKNFMKDKNIKPPITSTLAPEILDYPQSNNISKNAIPPNNENNELAVNQTKNHKTTENPKLNQNHTLTPLDSTYFNKKTQKIQKKIESFFNVSYSLTSKDPSQNPKFESQKKTSDTKKNSKQTTEKKNLIKPKPLFDSDGFRLMPKKTTPLNNKISSKAFQFPDCEECLALQEFLGESIENEKNLRLCSKHSSFSNNQINL